MQRLNVIGFVLFALLVTALASSPPPTQIDATQTEVQFCRKTKLMHYNSKLKMPVPSSKLLNRSRLWNQTALVHWGCVGPQPLTVTGTYIFRDIQDFNRFFLKTSGLWDFRQTPTITFGPRTKHYSVLKLAPETNTLACTTGTSKVSKARVTNTTIHKGGLRYPTLPRSWLANKNRTQIIRVVVNFTCTVDFSTVDAGIHHYDLAITSRGAAFTLTKDRPIIVEVPTPVVASIKGCAASTTRSTTGCLGRGTSQLTIYGWGFSKNMLSNQINFLPIDGASTNAPWCGMVGSPTDLPLKTNLTIIDSNQIKYTVFDPMIDQVPQMLVCNFWMYGKPTAEVRDDATRPKGRYTPRITVENKRNSVTGAAINRGDYRSYIEMGTFTEAPYDKTAKAVPLVPLRVVACPVKRENKTLAACQTNRILSYQASFQPLSVGTYAILQREILKLNATITSNVPLPTGVLVPSCISTSYSVKLIHNITRLCQTPQFTMLGKLNPTCRLNVTVRCALNFTGVPSGWGNFKVKLTGTPWFVDTQGLNFKVFVTKPAIMTKLVTSSSRNADNKTMRLVGYGFSSLVAENRVVFTSKPGSSSIVPTCRVFKVKNTPYTVTQATYFNEVPQELYCFLTEFPVAGRAVFGDFNVHVISEGRTSNTTSYQITHLTLNAVKTTRNQTRRLQLSNPEVIELIGTGFRTSEMTLTITPANRGAQCLRVHPTKFGPRTGLTQFTTVPSDTRYTCIFMVKQAGVYTIAVTQRDQTTQPVILDVKKARIIDMQGCNELYNDTSISKGGVITRACTGTNNPVSFLVQNPSNMIHFNEIVIGSDFNGVTASCTTNATNFKRYPTIDLRHIVASDAATNASVMAYFGSWPRFTANFYTTLLQRRDQAWSRENPTDFRGPIWFSCLLNSHSNQCPSRRSASGRVSVNIRRAYEIDVGDSSVGILFPTPKLTMVDAKSFCAKTDPLAKRLRSTKTSFNVWTECNRFSRSAKLEITGQYLDLCSKFTSTSRVRDTCGNDVTRYFACRVLITPVDSVAQGSLVARQIPRCNITTVTQQKDSVKKIVCNLAYGGFGPTGKWRIGMEVDGRTNDIKTEEFTIDFGAPKAILVLPGDKTCIRRSNTLLECQGASNLISVAVEALGAAQFASGSVVRFTSAEVGSGTPPTCKVQASTERFAFNSTKQRTNGTVTCITSFNANTTVVGLFRVVLPGVADTNLYVRWVAPRITGLSSPLCSPTGCPYPSATMRLTGTALNSGDVMVSLKAVQSYPSGSLPRYNVLRTAWDYMDIDVRFDDANKMPIHGAWYWQTSASDRAGQIGAHGYHKRVTSVSPTFTSQIPRVVNVQSKSCTGTSCDTGSAIEFTIAGRYFTIEKSLYTITLSGVGGDYACTPLTTNYTTDCLNHLYGSTVCPRVRALNTTRTSNKYETYGKAPRVFAEIIRCTVTIPSADYTTGSYRIRVANVGLVSKDTFSFSFKVPIITTPVVGTKIKEDCFEQANPIGCCTKFVEALAVSAGLASSSGKLVSCSRGSTQLAMTFSAATTSATALIATVASALSNPSSSVNQAYTVLASLGVQSSSTKSVDRAAGKRTYYACNTKDTTSATKVSAFLATCKVEKVAGGGGATEVVCTGDIQGSGCYHNADGSNTFFRSPSPVVTMCQRVTNRNDCSNVRYNGAVACSWVPTIWRCMPKDEYAYQNFKI